VIKVWRSFSCNNSSSFRLVARFADEAGATNAKTELDAFLAEATPLAQRRPRRGLTTATSFPATAAMDALAAEHGFDWTELVVEGVYEDDLIVVTEGATLVAFHPYTLGLGPALPAYFRAKGATVEGTSRSYPTVSVICELPSPLTELSAMMKRELTALFAQAGEHERIREWPIQPPWALRRQPDAISTQAAFFCDDVRLGFYVPIDPEHLGALREYLASSGITDPTIRLCAYADRDHFRVLSKAVCSHCGAKLLFLDKHDHAIESDQLACSSCGGMFDFATFEAALEP